MNAAAASQSDPAGVAAVVIYLIGLVVAYWIPTMIAVGRKMRNRSQVIVVNLFLGWTLVGWVVALVMALGDKPQPVPPQFYPQPPWR